MNGIFSYTVGDNVRMAVEAPLGVSVCGVITGQVPDDQSLIATGGQEHIGANIVILPVRIPQCSFFFFNLHRDIKDWLYLTSPTKWPGR